MKTNENQRFVSRYGPPWQITFKLVGAIPVAPEVLVLGQVFGPGPGEPGSSGSRGFQ